MFKNEYQGGAFVEIFSAQGKNPGAKWKILGSPSVIWKEFDKEVKSFVFVLEGSSQTNKIQLPKENKQILGLIQRFLVLQIYIPLGQDFSTELLHTEVFSSLCLLVVGLQPNRKAGITDLRNIKRRLYLSTVHKELSSTPLHAKIPLFMIKRKIWCNLCIDLVAFTNEIFKGAVFQSLDGITVSASCKLRKIFTLKYKPQDTADKDAGHDAPFPTDEPIDIIPRSCQLTTDVPQVTQLLNMTKLRQTEIKFGGHPLSSAESDQFINRGAVSTRNSKHQDVCHIAFGSKVLGPPPLSGRRNNMRLSNETIRSVGSKSNRSHQQSTVEKCVNSAEMLTLLLPESEAQRDKENIGQIKQTVPVLDEWIFPENGDDMPYLASTTQSLLLGEDSCHTSCLCLEASKESEHDHQTEETQTVPKDVFTFSSRPRSAPHGKTQTMSPEACLFTLDLKEDTSVTRSDTQTEEDFYGGDSSEEDNHSVQGSPGPTTSPPELTQLTLESVLGKAAKCASKGYLKNAYAEGRTSENQNSMAKQIDIKDFETSFVPTPSLSPPGRHEYSPKIPDPIIKAKDLPAHQVSTSTNKTFLKEISEEKLKPIAELSEYDWRNYQPSEISDSELQMLASLRRQQNEELEDTGALYGLSASQVDNCNVSISTSSDDTTTWNSCLPPPVNQGRHYQKEMNPPSPSNPRDWLNMLSPPIVPPSQQSAERHQDSSGSLSVQVNLAPLITVSSILHGKYRAITSAALLPPGVDIPPTQGWSSRTNGEEELSAEEDEEVLTLLYDPCLNCYFDPQTGKYYELV
ncbi:protein CFAP20DC isoform X8 [Cervus canadensis]|uniref:protein CFAP20DC isoform X8 n=1 Tax=Cervus canadensis TaxID=1574408 RepID=UPI001CA34541|nr:protein CFAP20DC isoform X8 [Cervus canadensis]